MGLTTLVLLMLATGSSSVGAAPSSNPKISATIEYLYELQADAGYQEGCFDPCECPILAQTGLKGTFILRRSGEDGQFVDYELSRVNWIVRWQGEVFHRIEGNGLLRLDEGAHQQQLLLDLSIDGEPPLHFDSGLVPLVNEFPDLNVTVSMNGMYCYDRVFQVAAVRTGPVGVENESGWSALKAGFR